MGACEGVIGHDCEGGDRFPGPGTRRWSSWIIVELVRNDLESRVVGEMGKEGIEIGDGEGNVNRGGR